MKCGEVMRRVLPAWIPVLLLLLSGVALTVAQGPARAEPATGPAPILLELFTSQGCSSCPPADALLRRLAADPDVIAIALHVDYWDYLGWRDPFAAPRNSARQRAYARHAGEKMVYTPQLVINGTAFVPGADETAIRHALAAARDAQGGARIALARQTGGQLQVTVLPGDRAIPATIHVVEVLPAARMTVTRGENAGRTLDHRNVVTDWRAVGIWDGHDPWSARVPAAVDRDIVVLVQEDGPGRVLAAARLR
jgi:hypothetical protein